MKVVTLQQEYEDILEGAVPQRWLSSELHQIMTIWQLLDYQPADDWAIFN